jgi:hypothetical protein
MIVAEDLRLWFAGCCLGVLASVSLASPVVAAVSIDPLIPVLTPYNHHDEPSVGVAVTIDIPTGGPGGTSVRFGPHITYIPYDRRDKWSISTPLSAEIDLFEWYVFQNRVKGPGPLKLAAEFRADPPSTVPDNLKFGYPGIDTGIEVILPFDGPPKLVYWSELTVGFGKDWWRVEMPLLRYSWDTQDGSKSSLLGLSLDLYAPLGGCQDAGNGLSRCMFTESWMTVSGGVPEPQTWALMVIGFGFVGWRVRTATRLTADVSTAFPDQRGPV